VRRPETSTLSAFWGAGGLLFKLHNNSRQRLCKLQNPGNGVPRSSLRFATARGLLKWRLSKVASFVRGMAPANDVGKAVKAVEGLPPWDRR
jgi:hypothetical protein